MERVRQIESSRRFFYLQIIWNWIYFLRLGSTYCKSSSQVILYNLKQLFKKPSIVTLNFMTVLKPLANGAFILRGRKKFQKSYFFIRYELNKN